MDGAHEFLRSLTAVLVVAAITTVVFQRLRQPVVLGYVLAGLIVGPHVPLPIVADEQVVQTLSELGVILLMFALGLEFSLRKLVRVGPRAGVTAVIQSGAMAWLGFLVGRAFGWTTMESIFTGAIVAISSTTIIAKIFDEQRVGGRLRELVVGVLLIEDLLAVVFMAVLTAVASGVGVSTGEVGATIGRLSLFLAALLGAGMLIIPRFIRYVIRIGRTETTLVASIGVCFAMAYVAQQAGYSVALGAFLAGSLVAESGTAQEIEHLVTPVKDMFAAIFFVSVGLLIDPGLVIQNWGAVLGLTVVVIAGKIVSVALGAFLTGTGTRTAIQAGMSLAQIGEFSFLIAALGISLGATRSFLFPVAVAVSAITTLTTPWLIRFSGPAAARIDHILPHRLQTFASLYGAWLERMGTRGSARGRNVVTRLVSLLVLDTGALIGVIIGASITLMRYADDVARLAGLGTPAARAIIMAAAAAVVLPLVVGIGRLSIRLGRTLAIRALPKGPGRVDFDAAPRRALLVMVEAGTVLLIFLVVIAATQAVLPSYAGVLVLLILVLGFGVALWRSTANLEGHVQAGALAVVQTLASYSRPGAGDRSPRPLSDVTALLPGLGPLAAVHLPAGSAAVGRSLAELNLRGRTGATILAISRDGASVITPTADERLQSGDMLALAGSEDAVTSARELLLGAGAAAMDPA